jgi:hypothetical protein
MTLALGAQQDADADGHGETPARAGGRGGQHGSPIE